MSTLRDFERTSCACDECRACCKRQPGPLAVGDFERIADYLRETPDEAARHFTASKGALVGDSKTGERVRIGSITPRRAASGACIFLDEHEQCTIHEVAPAGCALFDTHMGMDEANRRSVALAVSQCSDEYQELRLEIGARHYTEEHEGEGQ